MIGAGGFLVLLLVLGLLVSVFITPSLPNLALVPIRSFHLTHPTATPTSKPNNTIAKKNLLPAVTETEALINVRDLSSRNKWRRVVSQEDRYHSRAGFFIVPTPLIKPAQANQGAASLSPTSTPTPSATPAPLPTFDPVIANEPAKTQVIGFFVNWDDNSFTSLKQNITRLDTLIPEWLSVSGLDGTVTLDNPAMQQQVTAYVQQNRASLPIVPLVNNFDDASQTWQGDQIAQLLANQTSRNNLINSLLNYVQSNHFAGICIDFEEIPNASQPDFVTFMSALYGQFHPLGLQVSATVPVDDTQGYDYVNLAHNSDYLILMAYDEHWDTGPAGPIASQQWFASALAARFAQVDPSKYVVALGNYGYDWPVGSTQANDLSFEQIVSTLQQYNASITIDPASLNPYFNYTDNSNVQHQVWFLDATSAFNQIAETHRYPVRGIALWRLGSEDPTIWQIFDQRAHLDGQAADALSTIQNIFGFVYAGAGEISKISAQPSNGKRTIVYDPITGLVTNEQLLSYPSSYVITQWGASDKTKIALTFDDGPDPEWTPQILAILREYHVPGTFFVIGANAEAHPDILKQIYDQGNEIGNHTYTHPDISAIPVEQFQIELNATERLMESAVGHGSLLFRPPYAEDVQPDTLAQLKPLIVSSQLGYYTVGMQIDPQDYLTPGTQMIVQRVVGETVNNYGNVILLHDSGGDRSQTVAALPQIITQLRARGYQFVTVSALMGQTRDQVMPPIAPADTGLVQIDTVSFQTLSAFESAFSTLCLIGIILGISRFLVIATLAGIEKIAARRRKYAPDYHPHVAIIVPAYNEARVIERTIDQLLKSTYPNFEIVMVDDGSSDDTYQVTLKRFGDNPRVKTFKKAKAGKAEALNFGIENTTAEIIIAMDADTMMMPDAVKKLVRHLADPHIGAVAGNAKVGNRINLLTRWQALEYVTSQNLDRRAFAFLNCITVVPGAIGAWRRDLILELGGFSQVTLAEDADLTLQILRQGYKIEYEEDAIALTEAPDTIPAFLKQRFRWTYGTLQAAFKNLDALSHLRGTLGLVAIPNLLVFQIFFLLIAPLMDLAALMSIAYVILSRIQHPYDATPTNFNLILLFYLLFLLLDFITAIYAFTLEKMEDWKLIIWLFFQRFCYRQLMYWVALKSVLTALQGRWVGWGKLERKANVRIQE